MTQTDASASIEQALQDIQVELASDRPDLARRLGALVQQIRHEPTEPVGYISTGEAAKLLAVSPNTVKKWVRMGVVTDFWTLPGSGYLKIARTEVDRIRESGAAREIEP